MVDENFDFKYIEKHGQIVGIDEVGRGALAGPVVAAAVILQRWVDGIDDSKVLTRRKREVLSEKILSNSKFGFGIATPTEVDLYNVVGATKLAMERAYKNLGVCTFAIVDGLEMKLPFDHECIVKGDTKSPSIAAASIIANVYRDGMMKQLVSFFEGYDFVHNVGYGTPRHLVALADKGPTHFHRFTYSPVTRSLNSSRLKELTSNHEICDARLKKFYCEVSI